MLRHFSISAGLALAVVASGVSAGWADDAGDVRSAITGQLDAFRSSDAQAAYSFAAPNIRQIFPTAEAFMSMVEGGYPGVYRSQNATFGSVTSEGSGFRQEVYLSDPEGQSWIASYTLQRQPDGSLKITGCQIRKGNDVGA